MVFLAGIERSRVGPIGCYVVAVLLHYFVLAAFLWMLIEAHFMYLAFVKVWTQHGDHDLLKCSLIAWGKCLRLVFRFLDDCQFFTHRNSIFAS